MKNIPRKVKMVAIIIALAVTCLIIFLATRPKEEVSIPTANLEITGSVPSDGATSVGVSDPIVVTFNQPADFLTITVASDPTEKWKVTQNSPNSVKVDHELYLRVGTTYTLTVMQHGNPIGKIVFETDYEQNDPRFLQGLQIERNKKYPLLSLTPFETANFRVIYISPLTLQIDNKGILSNDEVLSQVRSWVMASGIDPDTHQYSVAEVLPTPQP